MKLAFREKSTPSFPKQKQIESSQGYSCYLWKEEMFSVVDSGLLLGSSDEVLLENFGFISYFECQNRVFNSQEKIYHKRW